MGHHETDCTMRQIGASERPCYIFILMQQHSIGAVGRQMPHECMHACAVLMLAGSAHWASRGAGSHRPANHNPQSNSETRRQSIQSMQRVREPMVVRT